MLHLSQNDWVHTVVDKAGAKEAKKLPYCHGAEGCTKVWYSRRGETKVSHLYLLALALAETHGKPVPHFGMLKDYKPLVDPNWKIPPPCSKRRKLTIPMNIAACFDALDWPEDNLGEAALAISAAAPAVPAGRYGQQQQQQQQQQQRLWQRRGWRLRGPPSSRCPST